MTKNKNKPCRPSKNTFFKHILAEDVCDATVVFCLVSIFDFVDGRARKFVQYSCTVSLWLFCNTKTTKVNVNKNLITLK